MNNSSVSKEMLRQRKEPKISRIVMAFNQTYKNQICVVEGRTDFDFYYKCNHAELRKLKPYYLYNPGGLESEARGKEAVIFSYVSLPKIAQDMRRKVKFIYIIDKDYEGIGGYFKKFNIDECDVKNITMVPYHSHESYFFSKNNLKIIFSSFNIRQEYDTFNNNLMRIFPALRKFYAMKATVSWAYTHNYYSGYKKHSDDNNIFNFKIDSNSNVRYEEDLYDYEIALMEQSINKSQKLVNMYKNYFTYIDSPEFIKGHTIFDLLDTYLKNKFGIELSKNGRYLEEIVKKLIIDLDVIVVEQGYQS